MHIFIIILNFFYLFIYLAISLESQKLDRNYFINIYYLAVSICKDLYFNFKKAIMN